MPISFECPCCGKKLKAPEGAVGKSSACPGCGNQVTCPEPIYDAEVVDDVVDKLDKPPGVDPYADLAAGQLYGLPDPARATPTQENRRPCPMCGEMILAVAAKCRYCGEVFDPALKGVGSKSKTSRRYSPEDSELSGGDVAIAVLCSTIGCIMGLVWMAQGKPKGIKMFGLSFVISIFWGVIRYAVRNGMPR